MLTYHYVQAPFIDDTITNGYDLINNLANMRVGDSSDPVIKELITNGTITNLNDTILNEIAELWALNRTSIAKDVLKSLTQNLSIKGFNYGFYIDDAPIYIKNSSFDSKNDSLLIASRMVSGIEYNKTRLGYVARAFAEKITKNTTFVLMGDVVSSSVDYWWNNGNTVNISYYFNLPNRIKVNDAYFFVETSWTNNPFRVYYDGNYIPGSYGIGSKKVSLNSYNLSGHHKINVISQYGYGTYEGGDDGASHLVVSYQTNITNTLMQGNKYYFNPVRSYCSIRYKKPIFEIGDINNMSIHLNLTAKTVYLSFVLDGQTYYLTSKTIPYDSKGVSVDFNNTLLKSLLSSHGISYSQLKDKYFWFQIDLDHYHSREKKDYERILHNDSYVKVSTTEPENSYGKIDLTKVLDVSKKSRRLSGSFYSHVEWNYNYSNEVDPVKVDSQLAWLYYTSYDPYQKIYVNSQLMYSHPPQNFILELSRFGYTKNNAQFLNGINKYIIDLGNGYGINPYNSIVSYTFLIKNNVPYGNTFPTEAEAINDAVKRLNETLGSYISAVKLEDQTINLSGVPTLWGPITVEIRIWK